MRGDFWCPLSLSMPKKHSSLLYINYTFIVLFFLLETDYKIDIIDISIDNQ